MVKQLYVNFVMAGMFVVRMLTFLLMLLLQRSIGGADIRTSPAA